MRHCESRIVFPALLGVAAILTGCGPRTYEDCILENMKGVGDRGAAGLIEEACREKFPKKKKPADQQSLPRSFVPDPPPAGKKP